MVTPVTVPADAALAPSADDFPPLSAETQLAGSKKGKLQKSDVFGNAVATEATATAPVVQSPIRHAGSKRNMNASPNPSPARTNEAINDVNMGGTEETEQLTPCTLEEKLAHLDTKESITVDEICEARRGIFDGRFWF